MNLLCSHRGLVNYTLSPGLDNLILYWHPCYAGCMVFPTIMSSRMNGLLQPIMSQQLVNISHGCLSYHWSLKRLSSIIKKLLPGRSQISYFRPLPLMYSTPSSNIPIWDGTGLYQPLRYLFTIQHCGILIMHLCSMTSVNIFLAAFIFQYSNRKLLPFQLRPEPSFP